MPIDSAEMETEQSQALHMEVLPRLVDVEDIATLNSKMTPQEDFENDIPD